MMPQQENKIEKNPFINKEALGGLLLLTTTIVALIASNSPLKPLYQHFLDTLFTIQMGNFILSKPLLSWINDGLMTAFFFYVGLELKRECLIGDLRHWQNVLQPIVAAIGGIVVPVMLYLIVTLGKNSYHTGWAIPMATDIAFAVGILSLLGNRIPRHVKLFLLTLAIVDDIAAILVIALFHSQNLSLVSLVFSLSFLIILIVFNFTKVTELTPYFIVGLLLWLSVLKSGVHATLSGILIAFTIPLKKEDGTPIITQLETDLHDFIAYFVLPLFAFANAGVKLQGMAWTIILHPVTLGVFLGLFIGKPLGIFSFSWLTNKIFRVPLNITNSQLLVVGLMAGIGFTMSLFIAMLSFETNSYLLNLSRLGVLLASAAAMCCGLGIASRFPKT